MSLDFQKLSRFTQELKSDLMNNINDTLMHCPEISNMYVATDSQVCFHRWHFANYVKLSWCITGPVELLGHTNQYGCGVKLLPMSVLTNPVDCVHLCHLLRAQHHCLCSNGREGPLSACPPTPTTPLPPTHPLILDTYDITGVVQNYLKNQR